MRCCRAFSYDLNHMNTTTPEQRLLDLLTPALLADCEALQLRKGERLFATGQRPRHLFWVQMHGKNYPMSNAF